MQFNYRLINPLAAEKKDYINLHRDLFKGTKMDNQWLQWYHKDIPGSDKRLSHTRTYGLFDKDKLIGIWSVEPKILRLGNKKIKVGRCFAVGISSDYRRMGLFVKLSEFAIKSERELGEYEYILGFPQTGRAVVGGHLKAGWEEVQLHKIVSFKPHSWNEEFSRYEIDVVKDFNSIKYCEKLTDGFDNTNLYRNVRFIKHPRNQYINYSINDALIIIKQYSNFYHLIDMQGSKRNINKLINVIKSIAVNHGIEEINAWDNINSKYHDILKECGFVKGAKHGLPITLIAVRINSNTPLIFIQKNVFCMGVEEGY